MADQLTPELIAEGNWFFQLLLSKGDHHGSALKFKKALDAGSGLICRHAKIAWDNGLSPCPLEVTPEEKQRAGEFLVALGELREGRGPKPRGNVTTLKVPLTAREQEALEAYCERHGVSQAEAGRLGLRRLFGMGEEE